MAGLLKFIQRERLYILLLTFVILVTVLASSADSRKIKGKNQNPQVSATSAKEDQAAKEARINKAIRENGYLAVSFTLASLLILLVLIVGIVADAMLLSGRSYGKKYDIRTCEIPVASWNAWDVGKVIVLFLFFGYTIVIIESVLAKTVPAFKNDDFRAVFNSSILDALGVIFIIHFTIGQYKEKLRSIGINFKNFMKNVFYGIVGYIAAVPVLFLVLILTAVIIRLTNYTPKEQIVVEMFMRQTNPAFLIYTGIFAVIAGPITEELFFRAFMYSAVKKYIGIFWATMITASIFAFLHGHVVGFLPIMVLGILLAYLYERTGTLVSSITVHMCHNFSMVLLVFLAKSVKGI